MTMRLPPGSLLYDFMNDQAKHSAEIGMPRMRFPMSLFTCFHDRWSRRKWSSFYAAINASEASVVSGTYSSIVQPVCLCM